MDLSFEAGWTNAVKTLGRTIRDRRLELLLTQTQVAGAIGIGQVSYGQIERGVVGARLVHLLRIAHALNTTVSKLMDGVKL
jgi:transcriptional regulator with XRE-family HTH domain